MMRPRKLTAPVGLCGDVGAFDVRNWGEQGD